ncbi:MAG TPA: metallophosphoesterase [Acidobacteriota bacterium]
MIPGSLRLAVIGDSGTGGTAQYQVARRMTAARSRFPFEMVLMLGDNLYGSKKSADYRTKFEDPYRAFLDAGVKFYAVLGNHDEPSERFYKPFNMADRYYEFKAPRQSVRFFALDTNLLDPAQLRWFDRALSSASEKWKICFFHHPLYTSGTRHQPDEARRALLEPLMVRYGVSAVLAGHDHFYQRLLPQKGIQYFISGGSAKLRLGDIRQSQISLAGFDRDYHFMLIEIAGDNLYFQTISRTGATVDSGVVPRRR